MKQIFNWTIGSFFRTIGRTIAFLAMGGLIYYILSTNGFEFGIKDLFFENVKAKTTYENLFIQWYDSGCNQRSYLNGGGGIYAGATNTIPSSSGGIVDGTMSFFPNDTTCLGPNQYRQFDNRISYFNVYMYYDLNTDFDIDSFQNGTTSFLLYNGNTNLGSINMTIRSNNGVYATCNIESIGLNTVMWKCPFTPSMGGRINRIDIQYSLKRPNYGTGVTYGNSITIGIQKSVMYVIEEDITSAINQQTQQQQQNHEETQSYLEDSNTTEAESEATDFFEDFEAPDIGGLGAIITAPLNTIRSLLNSSCSNLVLPLPFVNKNLTLPCMNTIYTEHFGAFFTIYQTIILAVIAYRCIRSIFFDIHGFTNPNDDRIEVMDL